MMLGYVASFAVFVTQSEDFIVAESQARRAEMTLPITLDLTTPAPKPEALAQGWSHPESWGTWTLGNESTARFKIPELRPGLKLRLRIHSDRCFTPTVKHPVAIEVYVDKVMVMEETFDHIETVVLETDFLREQSGNHLDLVIRINGASSAVARGLGRDRRIMGIGVSKIEILSVP